MIVDLEELKSHLNQTLDADDDLIEKKAAAAQSYVENWLGYKIESRYGGDGQDPIPEPLREVVFQLTAHWYENREASLIGVTAQSLPFGFAQIVDGYRDYSWGEPNG